MAKPSDTLLRRLRLGQLRHLLTHDVPEEAGEFAGDSHAYQLGVLAGTRHAAIAPAQAHLRLPGNLFRRWGGVGGLTLEMLEMMSTVKCHRNPSLKPCDPVRCMTPFVAPSLHA